MKKLKPEQIERLSKMIHVQIRAGDINSPSLNPASRPYGVVVTGRRYINPSLYSQTGTTS